MKKGIIIPFIFSIVFFSCSISNEKKAKKLISDTLYTHMDDYSSYESIEFSNLDSAFTSLDDNTLYIESLELIKEFNNIMKEDVRLLKHQAENRYIYSANDMLETHNRVEIYKKKVDSCFIIIDSIETKFKPEFIGFQMSHRFREKARTGNFRNTNLLFLFDAEVKEVVNIKELG